MRINARSDFGQEYSFEVSQEDWEALRGVKELLVRIDKPALSIVRLDEELEQFPSETEATE